MLHVNLMFKNRSNYRINNFIYIYVFFVALIFKNKYLFSILTMNKRLALTLINTKIKHRVCRKQVCQV